MLPIVSSASISSSTFNNFKTNDFELVQMHPNQKSTLKRVQLSESEGARKVPSPSESVFACEFIKRGSLSDSYKTKHLITHNPYGKLSIRKTSSGLLRPVQKVTSWIRSIKLSPDVYSHNAIIELNQEKNIHLRASKDIAPGEELVLWFSEQIALLMNIPFLTPANIIDNKCYSCHFCKTSFESPNPLKIHLALACGRDSINILWIKLHCSLTRPGTNCLGPHQIDTTPSNVANNHIRSSSFIPITPNEFTFLPITQISHMQSITDHTGNTAAQIETIVSNMGTSKQGHLCIYCGKVYSRKYGLKIHIRTHTGFKPLKCKFCLRPFGDPSNLNKHVRLHIQAGNSTFKCHLCQKVLVRRRDLQRHLHTRHNGQGFSVHQEADSSSEDY